MKLNYPPAGIRSLLMLTLLLFTFSAGFVVTSGAQSCPDGCQSIEQDPPPDGTGTGGVACRSWSPSCFSFTTVDWHCYDYECAGYSRSGGLAKCCFFYNGMCPGGIYSSGQYCGGLCCSN